MFYTNKLKEKVIPGLRDSVDNDFVNNLNSERLDLYYVYFDDVPTDQFWHKDELYNYVGCVAYIKWTEEYVWYVEIRTTNVDYWNNTYTEMTNIPWMFLSERPIDQRGNWFMLEILTSLIPEIRTNFDFYNNSIIYSGCCLSENAISFFNKMVSNGLAEKTKSKSDNFPKYKLLF